MKIKLALILGLALTPVAFAEEMNSMDTKQAMPTDNRQMQHQDPAAQTAKATGTVRKIKQDKGTVIIAHGAVSELGWPAMVMGFKATPEQMAQLDEGDEIEFEFTSKGMNSIITSIKQL